jgi:hypothetical protein
MISDQDIGHGTCRLFWPDIRDRVSQFDSKLCHLIDQLDPGKKFPLYLSYYPYGELIADQSDLYFSMMNGDMLSLRDHHIPEIMKKELGYGVNDSPLGMGLVNHAELFIYLPYSRKSLFYGYFGPGSFFPFHRVMCREINLTERPNNSVFIQSGARTIFSLPGMGALDHFERLIDTYSMNAQIPKKFSEQYEVFKQIYQSDENLEKWHCGLIFFSEEWEKHLGNDLAWRELRKYLHDKRLDALEYLRNRDEYSLACNEVLKSVNEKPNAFLIDLMKYIFEIAAGNIAGFSPATDDLFCPNGLFLKAVDSVYESKRFPTIMIPTYYQPKNRHPVYCSLEAFWHTSLAPNSFKSASNLSTLKKLSRLVGVIQEAFHMKTTMAYDTVFGKIIRNLEIDYFHSNPSGHIIKSATDLMHIDPRFMQIPVGIEMSENLLFPDSSPFFKGCIQIATKETEISDPKQ